MKWVRASERLPDENALTVFKSNGMFFTGWSFPYKKRFDSVDNGIFPIEFVEWLDESSEAGTALPEDLEAWIAAQDRISTWRHGAKAVAEKLQPVIKVCKNQIEFLQQQIFEQQAEFIKQNREQIEVKDKEIELYKKKVEFYREATDKVREFISDNNDIGKPCQPLYDCIYDKLMEQKAEIAKWKTWVEDVTIAHRAEISRITDLLEMSMKDVLIGDGVSKEETEAQWQRFKLNNKL